MTTEVPYVASDAPSKALSLASACVQRVDHGAGQPLTLDEAVEAVGHPLTGTGRTDLFVIVAYLACQVVGLQHSQNADAKLAMQQVSTIVREFQARAHA